MPTKKALYCSPACRGLATRRMAICAQPDCGKLFHQVKSVNKFCSRECGHFGMKHRHTPATEATVTELWHQGLTVRKIAEATNLTRDAIDHLRARLKLPLRITREQRGSRRHGAYCHRPLEKVPAVFRVALPERLMAGADPLPPMHPISWGAIAL